jgi:capsular polysaccharide transport system permease protein
VWHALFLRESLTRLFGSRAAWMWLLVEPLFHLAYMTLIFSVIRLMSIGGIDTVVWLMVGLLAYFMFQRTAGQTQNAVSANRALFAYRQVKPVDPVLVRAGLEAFLLIVISMIVITGINLFGIVMWPADPLAVIEAFLGLWFLGLGFGLVVSVVAALLPELAKVIKLIMMPMMIISGVILPISFVPLPYREWLMYNPIAHGLEAARLGFAPHYHAVPELSLPYMFGFALVLVFLGLALHHRFKYRLQSA